MESFFCLGIDVASDPREVISLYSTGGLHSNYKIKNGEIHGLSIKRYVDGTIWNKMIWVRGLCEGEKVEYPRDYEIKKILTII